MADRKTRTRKSDPRKINHVVIILDKSGSMATIRQEAVDAFNNQIETIKKATKGKRLSTKVTFVTFDTTPNAPTYFAVPLSRVKSLTLDGYNPNGWTAMYDAVGDTLTQLQAHKDFERESTTALVLVISDGVENMSKRHNQWSVSTLVGNLQATKRWTFTYAGANQDLLYVSRTLNIPLSNTLSFDATSYGYKAAQATRSRSTELYYANIGSGQNQTNDFYNPGNTTGGTTGKKS